MRPCFIIEVEKDGPSSSFLERGFLKCIVRQPQEPFRMRSFLYCLHCFKLGSQSWFDYHKKAVAFDLSEKSIANHKASFSRYVRDIESEVELLNDSGKLFKQQKAPPRPRPAKPPDICISGSFLQPEQRRIDPVHPADLFFQEDFEDEDNQTGNEDGMFQRTIECLCDCLEKACFVNGTFDSNAFVRLSQALLKRDFLSRAFDEQSFSLFTGKIISFTMRKLFVTLALSKKQMDTLNSFFKALLLLTSHENDLHKHVHAGYLSCVRECERRVDRRDVQLDSQFEKCEVFSLALDTALFGQEHVLSCIARLTFKDRMTQFPLFFGVCHASTGEEMATYVFHMLKRKHAPFEKLSCVTTDGANNMTGKQNGMVAHLRKLVRVETGDQTFSFPSIWCLSHRMNLVIRSFEKVDHIKNVLKFADWFSTKRKAVGYKKWLNEKYPNTRFKKIPKPSETRWCFYRDVLDALLSQSDEVDAFLRQDEDFVSVGQTLWPQIELRSEHSPLCFLGNQFVHSHFLFARFILDKICIVNTALQQQYMTIPLAWKRVQKLKEDFENCLTPIKEGDFRDFEYLQLVDAHDISSFQEIINALLFNMDFRFLCPSFSIDKRQAQIHMNPETKRLEGAFVKTIGNTCQIYELVGLFLFPDDLIKNGLINQLFLSPKYPEVPRMANEIAAKKELIVRQKRENNDDSNQQAQWSLITLQDVFQCIRKEDFPFLWEVMIKAVSFLPTSANCEQSFSCLKHRLHENLKKKTAFNFLISSQNNTMYSL